MSVQNKVIFILGDSARRFNKAHELVKFKKAMWLFGTDIGSPYRFEHVTEETGAIVVDEVKQVDDIIKSIIGKNDCYIYRRIRQPKKLLRPIMLFLSDTIKPGDIPVADHIDVIELN